MFVTHTTCQKERRKTKKEEGKQSCFWSEPTSLEDGVNGLKPSPTYFSKNRFQKMLEPYSLCSEGYPILFGRKSFKNIFRSKTKTRPLQWYHPQADLIWPDGPFRTFCTIILQIWLQFYNHSSSVRYALYRRIVYFALQHTVLWISTNNLSFIRWTKLLFYCCHWYS